MSMYVKQMTNNVNSRPQFNFFFLNHKYMNVFVQVSCKRCIADHLLLSLSEFKRTKNNNK